MPEIPRNTREGFETGRATRAIPAVPADVGLESTIGELGKDIERIARQQQAEEDTNSLYNSITDYNEKLIPILEEERSKQGKDTAGNIERVSQSSQTLRDEIVEKAHPRVRDKLNANFDRIDLGNDIELSRLRTTGIKVEREQKRDRVLDNAKKVTLNNPNKALSEMVTISEMYQEEVDAGILTEEEARLKTEEAANSLAVAAITSIGEKSGPTAQLVMLQSGMFDALISADQKEEFVKQATALEKAVNKQKEIDEKQAKKDAKDALKEAQDATEDDFFNRWDDEESPVTIPEIEQSKLEIKDKIKWRKHVEEQAEGKLLKTNWTRFNEINSELYTEKIADWSPAKINEEVKEGGIAIGGKGSEAGAKELISTYNSNTKITRDRNPKLGVILKQVDSLSKNLIFVPDFEGGEPTPEQDITNAIRHAEVTQRIIDRVNKGEDAAEAFESEMKPYREEKAKGIWDKFISFFKSGEESIDASLLEGKKPGRYRVGDTIIKWDGTKVIP